ncbi:hypothetical protein CCYA_CCYA15G3981 [Cyanidiococcus yangmingshanensis]|nr:hypothetical protein CCYA_CCYA15G3981 [Cyanidiococcus yangmingshanensis]
MMIAWAPSCAFHAAPWASQAYHKRSRRGRTRGALRVPRCQVYHEGLATFELPPEGSFYRAASKPVRDLGVLAALALTEETGDRLHVADLLSGVSAVRALRYAAEANAKLVLVNDAISGPGRAVLRRNSTYAAPDTVWIQRHEDLFQLACSSEWTSSFDLVDIDAFGTGAPEVASGVLRFLRCSRTRSKLAGRCSTQTDAAPAPGALLYACSTASVTAAGLNPQKARQTYGVEIARHAAVHEQGLRLLITMVRHHALQAGLIARPLFSYYHRVGDTFRVMFRVTLEENLISKAATTADHDAGLLCNCVACGQLWCIVTPNENLAQCPGCGIPVMAPRVRTSGPFYLGPLHDPYFVERMLTIISEAPSDHFDGGTQTALKLMLDEATRQGHPFYYRIGDLARRAGCSPPPLFRFLQRLELAEQAYLDAGRLPRQVVTAQWRAARASVDAQGIRTGLPMPAILEAMREISS